MQFSDIETKRLELELLEPRHADAMFEGLNDKRAYSHLDESPPETVIVLRKRYSNLSIRERLDIKQHWINWVIKSKSDQNYLGYVQATVKLEKQELLVAYHVCPQFWRQGVATEAVSAMLDCLEKSYPDFVKVASIAPGNTGSIALIKRLGFQRFAVSATGDDIYRSNAFSEEISHKSVVQPES